MMRFASRVEPATRRVRPFRVSVLLRSVLLALAASAVASAPATAQAADDVSALSTGGEPAAARTAAATVHVAIPAIMRVLPESPVEVNLTPAGDGGRIGSVSLDCAANVPHTVEIRTQDGGSGLEFSADGISWRPLAGEAGPVVRDLPPGRRDDCATVRIRRTASGDTTGAPDRVRVAFEVRRAR